MITWKRTENKEYPSLEEQVLAYSPPIGFIPCTFRFFEHEYPNLTLKEPVFQCKDTQLSDEILYWVSLEDLKGILPIERSFL